VIGPSILTWRMISLSFYVPPLSRSTVGGVVHQTVPSDTHPAVWFDTGT
jgi:hypothetical protein